MKLKNIYQVITAIAISSPSSYAAVTLLFSVPFTPGEGVANGFADAEGTVLNGLNYGVIVDGSGNGFSSTYDPVAVGIAPSAGNDGIALTVGAADTYDRLYFAQDVTANNTILTEGDFTTTGGDGGIQGIVFDFAGLVNEGDTFMIIWFDPDGINAGTISDPSFVVPTDGFIVNRSTPFIGIDLAKPAVGTTFIPVPEPSTALLGALGAFFLLRRRR